MEQASRILRDRAAYADAAFDASQAGGDEECTAAILVQTIAVGAYPTAASSYFGCNPVYLGGNEQEGNPATYVADTSTVIYVLNLGSAAPPQGTYAVADHVGNRWCMDYNGGS